MKKLLLILGLSLSAIATLQAGEKFAVTGPQCLGKGMSPNGQYVVGVDATLSAGGTYIRSYLYHTASGQQEWLTEYDETEPGKSGNFTDVTDNGTIAGSFRDPDYQITVEGALFPINVAAVWKDGQRTSLGIGDFKLAEFTQLQDGSVATAISNDGNTVVGNIGLQNNFSFPCLWKYDASKSEWVYSALSLPEDAVGGKANDVSADGKTIVGTVWYKTSEAAVYWVDGVYHLIEGTGDDAQYNGENNRNATHSISPNGKYIAFVFNRKVPAVYEIATQTYKKPEAYSNNINNLAIADNGNLVSSYSFGHLMLGKIYQRPFWYSYQDNRTFGFDYFMDLFAPGVEPSFTFLYEEETKAIPCAVSADGTVIMGNNDTSVPLGGIPESWVLFTDEQNIAIPEALKNIQAGTVNLKEVTVSWEKEKHTYEGLTLQGYAVYSDGKKIADVPGEGKETLTYVQENVTPGYLKYSVASVFKVNASGNLIESPKSEPVTVAVPDTYSLPLYDDFDSGSTETNYWTKELQYGDPLDANWSPIVYTGVVDKGLYVACTSGIPYSSTFTSRPMDATDQTKVGISFAIFYMLVNSNEQPLDKDTLSIDVTVDKGNTWTEVNSYVLNELSRQWCFRETDLSPWVAGKLFQVRLRKHGQGATTFNYCIDLLKVGTEPEKEAPEGLAGSSVDNRIDLIWKNSCNAYQLNYLTNNYSGGLAIGDEGKPFIAANAFDAKDLEPYKGKYLTSVKAFVNHHSNIEDSKDTHASVVVFEDGHLVREQEIESIAYNEDNIVVLNEPLLIDASKELKIGMKIFDYDERQIPITYQNTNDFVAGKSDLYSQDNGKTWQKLSDFYATVEGKENDGHCCWEISGCITDEQTVEAAPEEDQDLFAYNVFRNGEQLNSQMVYRQQTRYTDNAPLDQQATYEVVAYYLDGSVSDVSNAIVLGGENMIRSNQTDSRIIVTPNPATDYLTITGEFDRAILYSLKGEAVTETRNSRIDLTGLAEGVYLLKVESRDGVCNQKVMIRK